MAPVTSSWIRNPSGFRLVADENASAIRVQVAATSLEAMLIATPPTSDL